MEYQQIMDFIQSNFALGAVAILLFYVLAFAFFAIGYILDSLCLVKIFRAYNYPNPYYAFIPFYNLYILANLTCDENFKLGEFKIEKKYFIWWWVIYLLISYIVPFKIISFIIKVICLGFCYHNGIKQIDNSYDNKILSYAAAIFPIILWFVVLPKKIGVE